MLAFLCHFEIGVGMQALDTWEICSRVPSLVGYLCDKTSSLPVVNDHVSLRDWPLPLPQRSATEGGDSILGMATEEDLDR